MTAKVVIFDVGDTLISDDGKPVHGVVRAIAELRNEGLKVAAVWNKEEIIARRALHNAGIDVDLVVGRDTLGGARKPSPLFVTKTAALLKATVPEVIYVGNND